MAVFVPTRREWAGLISARLSSAWCILTAPAEVLSSSQKLSRSVSSAGTGVLHTPREL